MKILICDDHALFREGLKHVLTEFDAELIECGSAEAALAATEDADDIDVVLLDLGMPGMNGFEGLRRLRADHPELPVVIVSASERPEDVRAALDGGASGFIPKSSTAPVLRSALQLVLSGGVYVPQVALSPAAPKPAETDSRRRGERAQSLTPRQLEVLNLMARGLTNREICGVLGIAEGTVKTHIAAIFETLDVTNRTEAAVAMRELGLEPPD